MSETWRQIVIPLLEGMLALAAALAAVAFRRRTRMFTPAGFIMLSLGLTLDLLAPLETVAPEWARYLHASAVALLWCGIFRLMVESIERWIRSRRVHVSTITTELVLTTLYAGTLIVASRDLLNFEIRRLVVIPTLLTLIRAAFKQRDFLSGLLIQSQRPFRAGDWVRVGTQVGQVQGIGWRAMRIQTRENESVTVPSALLMKDLATNYSMAPYVADTIFIELASEPSPALVEEVIEGVLRDVPEIVKTPPPEVDPWELGKALVRYRIKYWLADYKDQEPVRQRVLRAAWYALQRSLPSPARAATPGDQDPVRLPGATEQQFIDELRRVDLLHELSDEDLRIMLPSIKVHHYGRGEVLIRQGEAGDCFFVLRHGQVEVSEAGSNRDGPIVVGHIDHTSERPFFGEIALLKGEPRLATVRAITDLEVLAIDRLGFTHLFRARPEIAATIAEIASLREEQTLARTSTAADGDTAIIERRHRTLQTMRRIFDF